MGNVRRGWEADSGPFALTLDRGGWEDGVGATGVPRREFGRSAHDHGKVQDYMDQGDQSN